MNDIIILIMYILVGVVSGVVGGTLGVGGGIIMVPAMVFLFGLTQHQAQGTTIAVMLPPILILAAIRYYQEGNVNIQMACFVAVGFVIGAYLGATLAHLISDGMLKRIFGFLMILIGMKMIFFK